MKQMIMMTFDDSLLDRPIYLDYHATTPVDRRVAEVVLYYMTTAFGNASSVDHIFGDEADAAVKQASKQVAGLDLALVCVWGKP